MRPASSIGFSLTGLVALIALSPACDKFEGKWDEDSEFNAGGVDPFNFPPDYRGAGQIRQTAASGTFTEVAAFANGTPVGYFQFPFSPSQVLTTNYAPPSARSWPEGSIDPLRVAGPGTDFRASLNNPVPVPSVYNFDPPGNDNPFPDAPHCKAPPNYTQNKFLEAFPQNEQWNIFTFLPDRFTTFPIGALPTWSYRPVVAEVPVQTTNLDCQSVKSERKLLSSAPASVNIPLGEPESDPKVGRLGKPDGKFLAWAIIDPGAGVYRVGTKNDVFSGGTVNGTSVQKYGWYAQFIVAYIDGGYIPTEDGPIVAGAPTTRMRTQRLYYPRSPVYSASAKVPPGVDPSATAAPGMFGQGYDVLQGDRFGNNDAYSPVCELWTYSLPGGPTEINDLPKDEATILQLANSTLEPARTAPQAPTQYTPSTTIIPKYIFCLQAAPREGVK
jgi:hypothetical protein